MNPMCNKAMIVRSDVLSESEFSLGACCIVMAFMLTCTRGHVFHSLEWMQTSHITAGAADALLQLALTGDAARQDALVAHAVQACLDTNPREVPPSNATRTVCC